MWLLDKCRLRPRSGRSFLFYCLLMLVLPLTVWVTYRKNLEMTTYFKQLRIYRSFNSDSYDSEGFAPVEEELENLTSTTPIISTTKILKREQRNISDHHAHKRPVILMWSKYYNREIKTYKPTGRIQDPKCCDEAEVTFDRTRLNESIAVVIYHWFNDLNPNDLPPTRTPEQLWVLYSKESSCRTPDLSKFDNLFNLTMTYRHDSDIFSPYGYTKKLDEAISPNEDLFIGNVTLDEWIQGKNKLFAGVISHCKTPSKREIVAELIKEYLDIYGACGIPVCPRNADKKKCNENEVFEKISREYKFYFSAENSLSQDYITEKFWRTLINGVVPVVYGGGNYSAVAPPKSFIDSRDFKSPEDLVLFLMKLGNDTNEYKEYFQWRRNYTVYDTDAWQGWCDLCKYVKNYVDNKFSLPEPKIYRELKNWWSTKPNIENKKTEGSCSGPFWKLSV